MRPSARALALLTIVLAGTLPRVPAALAGVGDDTNWIASPFFPVGADHEAMSCLVHDGDLVISGNFAGVGDVMAEGVARWDGSAWSAYPGTEWGGLLTEMNGTLTVVRAYPIPVAPSYTGVDVLSWNGSGWDTSPFIFQFTGDPLVNVVDRTVAGVAVLDGDLYVTPVSTIGAAWFEFGGGVFPRIARWDGSAWSPVIVGGTNAYVALEAWNGQLFASGFDLNTYDSFIDVWDGVSWTRLWTAPSGAIVTDFAVYGGQLVAARQASGLLLWNGTTWTPYANPIVATVLAPIGSELAAATGFEVQEWDGSLWTLLGGLQGSARGLVAYGAGLAAAGDLPGNVSLFDGTSWEIPGVATGQGLIGDVEALATYEGKLFVAGQFSYSGSSGLVKVAAWDGTGWETVRDGSDYKIGRSLTVYDGKLVVGEAAEFSGVSPPNQIGTWDGAVWTPIGSSPSWFQCLAAYGGNLIAGGLFTTVDAVSANHLAAFDGVAWSELGNVTGLPNASNPVTVNALTVWNGLLIVGGTFDTVDGGAFDNIASWNGSQWRDLEPNGNHPPVVTGTVKALAVYNGNLVASGSFWGTDVIAFWDGHDWTPMGSGLNAAPQALASYGGYLVASGENLTLAGGVPVNRIAAWDGVAWDALGSGLEHPRQASESPGWALAEYQGVLYVGGNFRSAGGQVSDYLARWVSPLTVAVGPDEATRPTLQVHPGVPNPFRSTTRIEFTMPAAGRVVAEVFDVAGRSLGTVQDGELPSGIQAVVWNPHAMRTASGTSLPGGTYFIHVRAPGGSFTRKVVYIP